MRLALVQATSLFQEAIVLVNFSGEAVIKILSEETQHCRFANAVIVKYAGDFSFDILPGLQSPTRNRLFKLPVRGNIREGCIDGQSQFLTL